MQTSVFDPAVFRDPPNIFRPLQIIHGMDNLAPAGGLVTNVSFTDYLVDQEIHRQGHERRSE